MLENENSLPEQTKFYNCLILHFLNKAAGIEHLQDLGPSIIYILKYFNTFFNEETINIVDNNINDICH